MDEGVTKAHIRAAVRQLHDIRGRKTPLDILVDRFTPRVVAHVAEEALHGIPGGRPLNKLTGEAQEIIKAAIAWLNTTGLTKTPEPRKHSQAVSARGVAIESAGAVLEEKSGDGGEGEK